MGWADDSECRPAPSPCGAHEGMEEQQATIEVRRSARDEEKVNGRRKMKCGVMTIRLSNLPTYSRWSFMFSKLLPPLKYQHRGLCPTVSKVGKIRAQVSGFIVC